MLRIKNFFTVGTLMVSGLLLLSSPVFPHGGENGGQGCGNQSFDKSNLSKEQLNKIDEIQDKYDKEILPLRQKVNLLRTEAYNYSLNDNIDIEKVKDYRQQIRDFQGKIDDSQLDKTAEINKVLPKDQQISFNSYLNEYADNTGSGSNCGMMQGMMGNGMHGMMKGMMGNGMHGNNSGGMMGGMMNGGGSSNMTHGNGTMHGNGSDQ
ncbi:MAG: hypothetical protein WCE54_13100 [Ignavibacteriaceae bacterium]